MTEIIYKNFYVIEFSDGHTSPALDDMKQVGGYIASHVWGTELRKSPVMRVLRRRTQISPPTKGQVKREAQHQEYEGRRMMAKEIEQQSNPT